MKHALANLELINPLFLGARNHGKKITAEAERKLFFDDEKNWVIVIYNRIVKVVTMANVMDFSPLDPEPFTKSCKLDVVLPKPMKTHNNHPSKLNIGNAQISDPTTIVQNPRKDIA